MDRLSLDEEHYTRQEEWRRQLPESLGDGLRQGLSRLGISLLGIYGYTHTDVKDLFVSVRQHLQQSPVSCAATQKICFYSFYQDFVI